MKLAPPLGVEFRRLGRPKLLHASQIRSAVLVARDTRFATAFQKMRRSFDLGYR
jgi:hypothetical protein